MKLKLKRDATPTWDHSRTSQQGVAVPRPFGTRWCFALAPQERRGEGDCATHSQHSGPTSFPHERHRELQKRWSVASSGMCQLLHGVYSLLAPPPSSFDCQHDELAPSRGSEFGICRLLVLACLQQDGSVMVCGVWVGFTVATERTAQRDVHSQLRTGETRQILRENFDVPRILCQHVHVHVPEEHVLPDTRPCLPEHPRSHALDGGGSFLHPTTSYARSPVTTQRVQGAWQPSHSASVIWSGNWSRSSNNVRNRCGRMVNSGAVGQCANATPAFLPECERRWARRAAVAGQHGRLPEMRVRDGRRPKLPPVLPLSRFTLHCLRRSHSILKI